MRFIGRDVFGNEQFVGTDRATGEIILKTQWADAKAITDRNAELRKIDHGNGKDRKLVASLPMSIIAKWRIEHGVDIFNPDHQKAAARLLNDHQNRMFRIWEGNV